MQLFTSLFRDWGLPYSGPACHGCRGCCPALFYLGLCWWMLCCAILYSFSLPLCCANMELPMDYGWWWIVWADRCLGQSCWAGLVLTGGLGGMDPCSRASRGGGPKSRLELGSETVMRGTMCQDWQNSHTTRYPPSIPHSPRLTSSFRSLFSSLTLLTSLQNTLSPHFLFVMFLSDMLPSTPFNLLPPTHSLPLTFFPLLSSYWLDRLCHMGACMYLHRFLRKLQQTSYLPFKENQPACFSNC